MSTAPPATPTTESRPLSPAEVRHALLVAAIAWGIFGSGWVAMTGGVQYVVFVRDKLHASIFIYGLLTSLPFLAVLAQLPGSYLVERRRERRGLFLSAMSAQRATWFLVALLPWVIPARLGGVRVGIFLGLMLGGSALGHLGSPAWFSWFGDMVPEGIRGRYLSKRAALATVTSFIVALVVPWIIDRNSSFLVFSIIFALAGVFGLADINLFRLVREPPMPPHEGEPWRMRRVLSGPLRNRPFRGYLLYAFCESFMFGLAGPYFVLLALEFLHIDKLQSSFYVNILPMVFTAVALPLWGGVCDRFGAKPLTTFGTVMSIIYPICYLLATPGQHVPWLVAAGVIGGSFGAAVATADMSMMYALTPRENRSAYVACLMLASSLGWATAPIIAGSFADVMQQVHFHVGGLTFGSLHFIMFASLAARLLHVAFIIPHLPEEQARPTRDLVRHLVCCPFQRVALGFSRLADQVPFIRGNGRREE